MTGDVPIRVVIADDHPVVREGLRSFLATRPDVEVVGEARDADSAVAATVELGPDVVLVDLMMPGGGIDAIERITALDPPSRCLVLTSFAGDNQVIPALRAGAAGYLLKDIDPQELEAAIRTAHAGGTLLAPQAAGPLVTALRSSGDADEPSSDVNGSGTDDLLSELTPGNGRCWPAWPWGSPTGPSPTNSTSRRRRSRPT